MCVLKVFSVQCVDVKMLLVEKMVNLKGVKLKISILQILLIPVRLMYLTNCSTETW